MATRDIAAEINAAIAAGNQSLTEQLLTERYAKISADPTLMQKYGNDTYSQAYTGMIKAKDTGNYAGSTGTTAPVVPATPTTPAYTPSISGYTPTTIQTQPVPVSTPTAPVAPSSGTAVVPSTATKPTGTLTASAPKTGNAQVDAILTTMTQNSAAWTAATTAEQRTQLSEANKQLASQLSQFGIQATRDGNGVWNVLNYSGQNGQTLSASGLQGQTVELPAIGGQASSGSVTFMPDPIQPPATYITMSPDQMYQSIMNSATNVGLVFETVQKLAQQALTAGNIDLTAAIKVYTDQIESTLGTMQAKYDEMYADGPNDPGLQAALQLMREGAEETRQQMLEELNARGLSRSGLLVKAEERFVKGAASQEAQLIGQFMSQMYQTYMTSITNIMNQRVGYLAQMGQLQGEAAIQSATNRVNAINSAMGAMTDIGNTMAAMHTSAWSTAYDAYNDAMTYNETARSNYTREQETRRANMAQEGISAANVYGNQNQNFLNYQETVRSNTASEKQYDLKLGQDFEVAMAQLGLQERELIERVRANKASEAISWGQLQLTAQKYRTDAVAEANRLKLQWGQMGLEQEKLALDRTFQQFQIEDAGTKNALSQMELDLRASAQQIESWKTDVAKAEIMATHLASTKATLEGFISSVEEGDISLDTAMKDFQLLYPALGVTSGMHNVQAETSYYLDAKQKLQAIIDRQAVRDANWEKFSAGLNSMYGPGGTLPAAQTVPGLNTFGSWTPGITFNR